MSPAVVSALVSGGVSLIVLLLGRYWHVNEGKRDREERKRQRDMDLAPKLALANARAAAEFREEIRDELHRTQERLAEVEAKLRDAGLSIAKLERDLGESMAREAELEATLRAERETWAVQRAEFLRRIRSLEHAKLAAGEAQPPNGKTNGGHG